MSLDLRKMEWLWHVDIDVLKHQSKQEIMKTAGIAYDNLTGLHSLQAGDTMVIVVVRPPKAKLLGIDGKPLPKERFYNSKFPTQKS